MSNFKFKDSQKFRVIINGISMYTTATQIRWQFGDNTRVNGAVTTAMETLQKMKTGQDAAVGLAGTWDGFAVQIDQL